MNVALTGGIGSGKSTVAALFRAKGARVIDADALVHRLLSRDRNVRAAIRRKFGEAVFGPRGAIDRAALAAGIFRNPRKRRTLERIVHPAVRKEIRRRMDRPGARVTVVEIPLLFESGWKQEFDAVVVVSASVPKRLQRLAARGVSGAEARRRMRAQLPLAMKARLADYVINNDGTKNQTRKQCDEVWKRLTSHHDVVRGKNGLAERT